MVPWTFLPFEVECDICLFPVFRNHHDLTKMIERPHKDMLTSFSFSPLVNAQNAL